MSTFLEQILSNVRRGEQDRFLFFASLFGLITFAQTLGLTGSEALFLADIGIDQLPMALIVASLVTVLGSLLYAMYVDRKRNDSYFCLMLLIAAVVLIAASFFIERCPRTIYLLFCLYYLSLATFTNHYWTFTADYFDTLSSKRIYPLITVGASLGGLLGSLTGEIINSYAGPNALILSWGLACALAALLISSYKRRLRTWGPMPAVEADESSLEGVKRSMAYMKESRFSRRLLIAALAMVLSLFTAQYIYSHIFAAKFPQAQELATFLNYYFMITNGLELLVELFLAPFLIGHLGVARTNLVHPVITVLSFVSLIMSPTLGCAIFARANRELLDNALAGPVRSLIYNALPAQYRGRMRAFLEGVVIYSGMALAGTLLMLTAHRFTLTQLSVAGAVLAVLYLLASLSLLYEYLNSLVAELKAGRLDFTAVDMDLGQYEATYLGLLWNEMLKEDSAEPSSAVLHLTHSLAQRGIIGPIMAQAKHPSWVLRQCIAQSLCQAPSKMLVTLWPTLNSLLLDGSPKVVLAALHTLDYWQQQYKPLKDIDSNEHRAALPTECLESLSRLSRQDNPEIAAQAANLLGAKGQPLIKQMLNSSSTEPVLAALQVCSCDHLSSLMLQLRSANPELVAASLKRLSRLFAPPPIEISLISDFCRHSHPKVRAGAFQVLSSYKFNLVPYLLASGLNDSSREVRQTIKQLIIARGEIMVQYIRPYLALSPSSTLTTALEALAGINTASSLSVLHSLLHRQVYNAWRCTLILAAINTPDNFFAAHPDSQPELQEQQELQELQEQQEQQEQEQQEQEQEQEQQEQEQQEKKEKKNNKKGQGEPNGKKIGNWDFFRLALEDNYRGSLDLCFQILAGSENPVVVKSICQELRHPHGRSRPDALELLSNLGEHESNTLLVLLLEDGSVQEKQSQLPAQLQLPTTYEELFAMVANLETHWIRFSLSHSPRRRELMRRLLSLRRIPLFANMTINQLEAINRVLIEKHFLEGETILREGALGSDLYILEEGKVRVIKAMGTPQEVCLCVLTAGSYFGEMAILDDEPRSASVVADTAVSVLSLDGSSLKELILEMPEMSFEIFRILTNRVRSCEQRLKQCTSTKAEVT